MSQSLAGRRKTSLISSHKSKKQAIIEGHDFQSRCYMQVLPGELLELILLKSAAIIYRSKLTFLTNPSSDVYKSLAPTCLMWHSTLKQGRHCAQTLNYYVSFPYRRVPRRLALLSVDRGLVIHSLAQLNDCIYVICSNENVDRRSNALFCICNGRHPYEHLKTVALNGFSPWDLTASTYESCLYVSDLAHSCLWRVTPDTSSLFGNIKSNQNTQNEPRDILRTSQWTEVSRQALLPFTISSYFLDKEVNVLVLVEHPSFIIIFKQTSSGIIVIDISLPSYFSNLQHSVATDSGTFIVSYGNVGSQSQRLCEVSAAGTMIRACGGFAKDELRAPRHLAIETIHETLLLSDLGLFRQGRVTMIDFRLRVCRVLLHFTGGGASCTAGENDIVARELGPIQSMSYEQSRGLLLIGRKTQIELYSIKLGDCVE